MQTTFTLENSADAHSASIRKAGVATAVAIAVAAVLAAATWGWRPAQAEPSPLAAKDKAALAAMNIDDSAQILAEGEDAKDRNAAIAKIAAPPESARALAVSKDQGATYRTALKCLTEAVYYEAANEPLQGRRAVAQVVLNRVRHPGYPNSVCGVVYQGSERWTGCQFSFTCDGSLVRAPLRRLWLEAEAVATAALAGFVEKSVGTATHYHADYVLPKWAFQLGKIDQIGRHIFYRFNGNWGKSGAFKATYSGQEVIPDIDFASLRARLNSHEADVATPQLVPGLTVTPHVADRHATNDVGGRLDVGKAWRLAIPDPVQASHKYRLVTTEIGEEQKPAAHELTIALNASESITP